MFRLLVIVRVTELLGYFRRWISSKNSIAVGKPSFHQKIACFYRKLAVRINLASGFPNWAYFVFRLLVIVRVTELLGYFRRRISSKKSVGVGKPLFHKKIACFYKKLAVR